MEKEFIVHDLEYHEQKLPTGGSIITLTQIPGSRRIEKIKVNINSIELNNIPTEILGENEKNVI